MSPNRYRFYTLHAAGSLHGGGCRPPQLAMRSLVPDRRRGSSKHLGGVPDLPGEPADPTPTSGTGTHFALNRTLAKRGIIPDSVVINPDHRFNPVLGRDYVITCVTVGDDRAASTCDDLYTIQRSSTAATSIRATSSPCLPPTDEDFFESGRS